MASIESIRRADIYAANLTSADIVRRLRTGVGMGDDLKSARGRLLMAEYFLNQAAELVDEAGRIIDKGWECYPASDRDDRFRGVLAEVQEGADQALEIVTEKRLQLQVALGLDPDSPALDLEELNRACRNALDEDEVRSMSRGARP